MRPGEPMCDRRQTSPKGFRDGTDRLISPEQTLARVVAHLSGMGITRVADITGLDRVGIPVFVAVRPNSRGLATSQGKGLSVMAAKVSAIMESVESYHAEGVAGPLLYGSWRELERSHPLAGAHHIRTAKGASLDPDYRLLWMEGWDLIGLRPLWVPFDLVHTDFTGGVAGQSTLLLSSSGLAGGNDLLEATSHAMCELIERDAMGMFVQSGEHHRARRRVDPATVDDPGCRQVLDLLHKAGLGVAIWEVTADIGLPCFLADIAEDPAVALSPVAAAGGQGCHSRREIALMRALTEAVQSRLTLINGSRDDVSRVKYAQGHDSASLELAWASCADKETPRDFHDAPTFDFPTFDADVAYQIRVLRDAGIEHAVRVDLTRPDLEIPVVRMVIPQLESYLSGHPHEPGPRARHARAAAAA